MPGILVGVDGSDHSRRALEWAMREAAHHGVPLTVMTVHPGPVRPATQIYWDIPNLPEDSHNLDRIGAAVREFTDKVANEIGGTVPEITVNVTRGDPAQELVNASLNADLIVVGTRGTGAWAQLLLGSVSSKITHHAACPVVVIPATGDIRLPRPAQAG
jgi:nucleotide-binding universal stress UspA family protein